MKQLFGWESRCFSASRRRAAASLSAAAPPADKGHSRPATPWDGAPRGRAERMSIMKTMLDGECGGEEKAVLNRKRPKIASTLGMLWETVTTASKCRQCRVAH